MIWVVTQSVLMAGIAVSWLFQPRPHGLAPHAVGWVLIGIGLALAVGTRLALGKSFTVLPQPRARSELVTTGPFRLVRNPMYLGLILVFAGASLNRSWIGLGLTGVLAVLWAAKARVEERYLAEQFPEYAEYAARVRYRLVPFVY